MKKLILSGIFGMFFLVFLLGAVDARWCYQESANITDQTGIDGSCNLDYGGKYSCVGTWDGTGPCSNAYDGDWDSSGYDADGGSPSYLYVNYTKPSGAVYGSIVQYRLEGGAENYTLSSQCFNQEKIQIQLYSWWDGGDFYASISCYNGSAWAFIGSNPSPAVREEAMIWNISDTCDYSSGNWNINAEDNCVITSNVDLNGNNFTVRGTGTFTIDGANITNFTHGLVRGSSYCYQESANTTDQTGVDGSCDLNYSGGYVYDGYALGNNYYDGNWSTRSQTECDYYLYVNYTKPVGALDSSLWQVKNRLTGGGPGDILQNYTLNNNGCWDYNSNILSFRLSSETCVGDDGGYSIECRNSSDWHVLASDYNTNYPSHGIYEEAMIWDIYDSSSSSEKINLTCMNNGCFRL